MATSSIRLQPPATLRDIQDRGFEVGISLPPNLDSDAHEQPMSTLPWPEYVEEESQLWGDQFGLNRAQFDNIYGPFEKTSIGFYVRHVGDTALRPFVGFLRVGLPNPDAPHFQDNDQLTVHAAIDPAGTPIWGPMPNREGTFKRLEGTLDPAVVPDVQTNIVHPDYRGAKGGKGVVVVFVLHSLLGDFTDLLRDTRYPNEDQPRPESAAYSGLLHPYLEGMKHWYNTTDSNGEPIVSVEELGLPAVYGGDPYNPATHCTPVMIYTNKGRQADRILRPGKSIIIPDILEGIAPRLASSWVITQFARAA